MQSLRDNPKTAEDEFLFDTDDKREGLNPKVSFEITKKLTPSSRKPQL